MGGQRPLARAGRLGTFAKIVLPQVRPALLGGALLVALHLLAEFGVLAMLRFPTFTTAILDQYEAAFDTTAGSVLATVLMVLTALVLTGERFARGRVSLARIGSGVRVQPQRVPLGSMGGARDCRVDDMGAVVARRPVVCRGALAGRRWHADPSPALLGALSSTVGLALTAGVLTTVAAFPVALLLHRRRTLLTESIERITYFASSLPGVVVALALVTVAIRWIGPLYQTPFLLVIAYAILFIPRAMVSIRAAGAGARWTPRGRALARRQPVAGDPAGAAAAHRARSALGLRHGLPSPPVSS